MSAPPEPDWARWTPTERAALCFVVTGGRVLLIRKKRGLGAGKVNGPGGRLDWRALGYAGDPAQVGGRRR